MSNHQEMDEHFFLDRTHEKRRQAQRRERDYVLNQQHERKQHSEEWKRQCASDKRHGHFRRQVSIFCGTQVNQPPHQPVVDHHKEGDKVRKQSRL